MALLSFESEIPITNTVWWTDGYLWMDDQWLCHLVNFNQSTEIDAYICNTQNRGAFKLSIPLKHQYTRD